jgi:polar amino acid transport system substrate-binding protein
MHAYQDAPSAFTDLADGRVNALVIDTLLVIYQAKQGAGQGLTSDYLTPPSADVKAHPGYSAFKPSELLTKWGAKPDLFLKPSAGMAQQRQAVDRPASWTLPSIS